jgi:hypothetical protein
LSVSTQAAPHCVSPSAQLSAQAPSEQTFPLAQALLQVPQCAGSDATSLHALSQRVRPGKHAHADSLHDSPDWQAVPQAPQFVTSADVSTQAPLHDRLPVGQAQAPLTQARPAEQAIPHAPSDRS